MSEASNSTEAEQVDKPQYVTALEIVKGVVHVCDHCGQVIPWGVLETSKTTFLMSRHLQESHDLVSIGGRGHFTYELTAELVEETEVVPEYPEDHR